MNWYRRSGRDTNTLAGVDYRRQDVSYDRLKRGRWPRELRTIRKVLPEHLQKAPPLGTAAYGSWIVVASVEKGAVGFAWAVHEAGNPHGAYIEEVAVLPEFQRRGIGSQLVRTLALWMCELDRQDLSILPISGSGWLRRLGFSKSPFGSGYMANASEVARFA